MIHARIPRRRLGWASEGTRIGEHHTEADGPVRFGPRRRPQVEVSRSGTATLKPNPGINPQGPTTLTAIVDTGSGSIMSTIFGQVTTLDKQCTFMPTIGSSVVP